MLPSHTHIPANVRKSFFEGFKLTQDSTSMVSDGWDILKIDPFLKYSDAELIVKPNPLKCHVETIGCEGSIEDR